MEKKNTATTWQIRKHDSRFFAVYDPMGELVCVAVYKKGAKEVIRRLSGESSSPGSLRSDSIQLASTHFSTSQDLLQRV